MKLEVTETQFKKLVKNITLREQETPSEPTPGTSEKQSGGQGYPQVGKWESGVTRGPSNQIGVTKWSDVVGSTLKRSKGNQLK